MENGRKCNKLLAKGKSRLSIDTWLEIKCPKCKTKNEFTFKDIKLSYTASSLA